MVRVEKQPGAKTGLLPSKSGSTQKMASNIKVVVRVRPPNTKELAANSRVVVDVVDDRLLVFDPKEAQIPFYYQGVQQQNKCFMKRANKELKFVFDQVCGYESTNREVFELTTKSMLASLMEGYNCSVFVYGATGAGKTFTMLGNQNFPGITYLTMEHLFYSIDSYVNDREFDIGVSYIEVYNENVYDLLKPSKSPLQLREDSKYGVMVAGLTLHNIKTAQDLIDMLNDGNKNRTQHPTDANAESSRSHAVFQVYITMRYKTSNQVRMVKLSMIDLAGSERASATGCVGDRFKEGANINRSLLALGNCINKLADGSNYIPYRDSKLTRLLKDSLGGNCKTVMIANISPSSLCYEDTYNTLKYAARANKIQLSIKKNIVDGDLRTSQYVKQNEELKKRVKELEAKLAVATAPTVIKEDPAKEKLKEEWQHRLESEERTHAEIESQLLSLMSRQRVLALRHRLRTRAFTHIAEMAHRSSTEGMEQVCNEDIPRQERAAESYTKQSMKLESKIAIAWQKWDESRAKMQNLREKALQECPQTASICKIIEMQSKLRLLEARDSLRYKLLTIQNEEINAFANYMTDMPGMLKTLYLTLKGYDKVTESLTNDYMEIMRKAKSAKGISWSDDVEQPDQNFAYMSSLDLDQPSVINTPQLAMSETCEEVNEPGKKRKGTPIKIKNETIVIDDSFDSPMSAKKSKFNGYHGVLDGVENYGAIDVNSLNSTFVLANKIEEMTKADLIQPLKKGLTDRTNMMPRIASANEKARIVKPVMPRSAPIRKPPTAPVTPVSRSGFGSSVSRDGKPLLRTGPAWGVQKRTVTEHTLPFKAHRPREGIATHYVRPTVTARR